MATITIDGGGSYFSSRGIIRGGVHETDDLGLIAELYEASKRHDWIEVDLDIEEAAAVKEATKQGVAYAENATQREAASRAAAAAAADRKAVEAKQGAPVETILRSEPGDVPAESGPMTSADIPTGDEASKEQALSCPYCPGKTFGNRGGLQSHVRNKHPELDPSTLEPRVEVPPPGAPPQEPPTDPAAAAREPIEVRAEGSGAPAATPTPEQATAPAFTGQTATIPSQTD